MTINTRDDKLETSPGLRRQQITVTFSKILPFDKLPRLANAAPDKEVP